MDQKDKSLKSLDQIKVTLRRQYYIFHFEGVLQLKMDRLVASIFRIFLKLGSISQFKKYLSMDHGALICPNGKAT